MSNPLGVQQILDHCMMNIKGAVEMMADDMHDAAMKLGTAGMMLASASNAVHKHSAQLIQAQSQMDRGEGS